MIGVPVFLFSMYKINDQSDDDTNNQGNRQPKPHAMFRSKGIAFFNEELDNVKYPHKTSGSPDYFASITHFSVFHVIDQSSCFSSDGSVAKKTHGQNFSLRICANHATG